MRIFKTSKLLFKLSLSPVGFSSENVSYAPVNIKIMLIFSIVVFCCVIVVFFSDAREEGQSKVSGRGDADTKADQEANAWGRNGGDPNRYRPKGLPDKY